MLKKTRDTALYLRVLSLICLDVLMINASVFASLLIRFEFSIQALAAAGFVENYLRIDNSDLPAEDAATLIRQHFNL